MVKKHRGISRKKLVKKYFKTVSFHGKINRWVFFGENDRGETILLFQIGSVTMKPHTLISINKYKNPYLLEDQPYFEARKSTELQKSVLLDKRTQKLLVKQKGLCSVCNKTIDWQNEKVEIHHIKPVKEGGSDKLNNLVVVHWNCHRQIHS